MNASERYEAVNQLWPKNFAFRPLDADEAVRAVKKLLRSEGIDPKDYRFNIVGGNRRTWPRESLRGGRFNVNPAEGWKTIVHMVSHVAFRRENPDLRPHDRRHATVEARMIRTVLKRGWLDGSLRAKPVEMKVTTPADAVRDELASLAERHARWESKLKRARTAIRKIERRQRFLARKILASAPAVNREVA